MKNMLKWIDLEHKYILPGEETSEIIGISINGRDYIDGGDGELCVHVAALNGFKCRDLPQDKSIVLAVRFSDDYIDQGELPGEITLIGSKVHCIFNYVIECSGFTGEFDKEELLKFQKI